MYVSKKATLQRIVLPKIFIHNVDRILLLSFVSTERNMYLHCKAISLKIPMYEQNFRHDFIQSALSTDRNMYF